MIGLLLSLFFLIYLIYRGAPVLIVSPLMAMVAVFLGSDIPILYSWTGPFMQSVAGFVAAYFRLCRIKKLSDNMLFFFCDVT